MMWVIIIVKNINLVSFSINMNQQRIPIYLDCTLPNDIYDNEVKHNPFNEGHQFMLVKNYLEVKGLKVWK